MDYLKEMQSYQPEFYIDILEMQEILKVDSKYLGIEEADMKDVINNNFLQDLSLWGVEHWEKILKITPSSNVLDERISLIISKIRGLQKLNATRIKEIAQAYKNGDVNVSFGDSTIKVQYTSRVGIPSNFIDFENVIEQLKPAHLQLEFVFKYNTNKALSDFTHDHLSQFTYEQLRATKIT